MSNLTIQTILEFGEENGAIKTAAINCILDHLHQGHADMDLRIILASATPNTVHLLVEYGGVEPADFYYNLANRQGEPAFLSIEKGGQKLNPTRFVGIINTLIKVDAA